MLIQKVGYIILGVKEDKKKERLEERFLIQGISEPKRKKEDFWNTINSSKVNVNILRDEDVFIVEESGINLIVIKVPRADYKMRPVYIGENPYKGTFKRNNEGDYHAAEFEVDGMIRDKNPDGNDGMILEYYTMADIDKETLRKYRQIFEIRNDGHVWNSLDDKLFLEKLGGYRKNRREGKEGLTLAGLMMFGDGLAIRDEFDNVFMDYRDESEITPDIRWNDRITYDGTWENNLFNFFMRVTPKLTADLKKPFKLEGMQRIDETPVHKAVREAFVNLVIHADYRLDAGTLKIIKRADGFEFTNPGILKLPIEDIYRGGNSKPRNPRMQTMLRMIGFGDNAGSGFPAILNTWNNADWIKPELKEDTKLNQVTLTLKMVPFWLIGLQELKEEIIEDTGNAAAQSYVIAEMLDSSIEVFVTKKNGGMDAVRKRLIAYTRNIPREQVKRIAEAAKRLSDKSDDEKIVCMAQNLADDLEKSAEKSAEDKVHIRELSKRQKQILVCMQQGKSYSTEEIAQMIGLKGPRTRQLLNELVAMNFVSCTAATKKRRYIKE